MKQLLIKTVINQNNKTDLVKFPATNRECIQLWAG